MSEQVIPIERIEREAREAARKYSDVNDACPYPFGTDAAHAFASIFNDEKQRVKGGGE